MPIFLNLFWANNYCVFMYVRASVCVVYQTIGFAHRTLPSSILNF